MDREPGLLARLWQNYWDGANLYVASALDPLATELIVTVSSSGFESIPQAQDFAGVPYYRSIHTTRDGFRQLCQLKPDTGEVAVRMDPGLLAKRDIVLALVPTRVQGGAREFRAIVGYVQGKSALHVLVYDAQGRDIAPVYRTVIDMRRVGRDGKAELATAPRAPNTRQFADNLSTFGSLQIFKPSHSG